MDVSKNRDTPKWMVYFMENPIKMNDLGVFPYFWKRLNMLQKFSPKTCDVLTEKKHFFPLDIHGKHLLR